MVRLSPEQNYEMLTAMLREILDKSQVERTDEVGCILFSFDATLRDALNLPCPALFPEGTPAIA